MSKLAQVLAMMVLVAFAAGTSMQAAASTDMSMKMSIMTMGGEGPAGCQDCPGDDAGIGACDQACAITQAVIGSRGGMDWSEVAGITAALPPTAPDGHVGPPDPHPPRTLILI